jgi:hypothetical protein
MRQDHWDHGKGAEGRAGGPSRNCPAPSKFWGVALGAAAWSAEEECHLADCTRCRAYAAKTTGAADVAAAEALLADEELAPVTRAAPAGAPAPLAGRATAEPILWAIGLAAAVFVALALWWLRPTPEPFVQAGSRVESAELLLPDGLKAPGVFPNSAGPKTPARYAVTLTDIAYELKLRVRTRLPGGSLYQIGRHGITPLGSFKQADGVVKGSCRVKFEEQGCDVLVLVLVDEEVKGAHLAKSLDGFLSEDERAKLVEAATRGGVAATAPEVIGAALKNAGWAGSPADVLVVATVAHRARNVNREKP